MNHHHAAHLRLLRARDPIPHAGRWFITGMIAATLVVALAGPVCALVVWGFGG